MIFTQKLLFISIATALTLTACGGNGGSSDTPKTTLAAVSNNAKAQLGVLSNATVKIFEVGSNTVLFTEQTSSGNNIGTIGNFKAHEKTLNDKKHYIYEVSGGDDWDVNDDGIVDASPMANKGKFRSIVKGSMVKALNGKITISAVSEILYQKVKENISNSESLDKNLQIATQSMVKQDINNDGKIDQIDILQYNPVKDPAKLSPAYQDILPSVLDDIHADREIDLTLRPIIQGANFRVASNVLAGSVVGKLETAGVTTVVTEYTLSGEGNQFFEISKTGEIRTTGIDPSAFATLETIQLTAVAKNKIGNSNKVLVVITIVPADTTAPIFTSSNSLDVKEGKILSHQVQVDDTSSIIYTLEGDDAGQFTISDTGLIHSNSELDFETTTNYTLTIKAVDSAANEATQVLSITVLNTPDIVPSISGGSFEIADDLAVGVVVGQLNINEQGDTNITSFTLNGANAKDFSIDKKGTIKIALSNLNHQTKPRYSLTATATNEAGASIKVNLIITVKKIVYIRFTSAIKMSVNEATQTVTTLKATGLSSAPLSYSIEGGADAQQFSLESQKLTFKVVPDYEAPTDANSDNTYEVTIKISDTEGHSITKALNITIKNILDVKPTLENFVGKVAENTVVGSNIGRITISNSGDSAISKINLTGIGSDTFKVSNSGYIKLNKSIDFETKVTYKLTAIATNEAGNSNPIAVKLAVTNVNDAPIATSQAITMDEDTMKTITLSGSDEDGDTLSYEILTRPSNGILKGVEPNRTYTPFHNFYGTDSFTFVANDGTTKSTPTTITIKINDVEEPDTTAPVITLKGVTLTEVILGSTYTDAGATAVDNKDGNMTVISTGNVNTKETGIYKITYTAKDRAGNRTQTSRTVKVILDPNKERVVKFLYDPAHGTEPWITDGTPLGTYLLKDTNTNRYGISSSGYAVAIGNTVYFSGFYDGDDELWKTDGTPEGTVMVKNIKLYGSSSPKYLTNNNGKLLFEADDGIHGKRAWESDGTEEGTVMLDTNTTIKQTGTNWFARNFKPMTINGNNKISIKPIADGNSYHYNVDLISTVNGVETILTNSKNTQSIIRSTSDNKEIKHYGSYYYFGANFVSDGTKEGTIEIPNIRKMEDIIELNDKIYFINDLSSGLGEVYKMNRDGTNLEKLFDTGHDKYVFNRLVKFKNKIYFRGADLQKTLYMSDGTLAGTQIVTDNSDNPLLYTQNMTPTNNLLYFEAYTPETGHEIWITDGTKAGTKILKDIYIGPKSSRKILNGNTSAAYDIYRLSRIYTHRNKIYFSANNGDGFGFQPYISDGTSAGTYKLTALGGYHDFGYKYYFSDSNIYFRSPIYTGIFKTNGTIESTESLTFSQSSYHYPNPSILTTVGNKLFFTNTKRDQGTELWVSSGSRNTTKMVKDIHPGSGSSIKPWSGTYATNTKLYFSATDGINGKTLWESDGTEAGTKSILSVHPNNPKQVVVVLPLGLVNGKLLVYTGYPHQLYISDNIKKSFKLLKNIE